MFITPLALPVYARSVQFKRFLMSYHLLIIPKCRYSVQDPITTTKLSSLSRILFASSILFNIFEHRQIMPWEELIDISLLIISLWKQVRNISPFLPVKIRLCYRKLQFSLRVTPPDAMCSIILFPCFVCRVQLLYALVNNVINILKYIQTTFVILTNPK